MREGCQPEEFDFLLPKVRKKLFHGKIDKFGVQKYWRGTEKFQFDWINRNPIAQDFIDHFFKDGMDMGAYTEGALGFVPLQKDDIITKVTIDCDTQEGRDFCLNTIAPKCKDMDMDYIIEHGGNIPYDRLHFTFIIDKLPLTIVKPFFRQFFAEMGEPILGKNDEEFLGKKVLFDEVYGVNQVKRLCRWFYGFNAKKERQRRYPCEYKGEDLDDVISVMKALLDMKPITDEFMRSYIKNDFFPAENEKINIPWESEVLHYKSLDLPLPIDYIPEKIVPVFKNCQALNEMINEAMKDRLIEEQGQQHHDAGFALAGCFRYVDVKYKLDIGRKAWDQLKADGARLRSDKQHNWWYGEDKQPAFYIWTCAKYDEAFGRCGGCPFKGTIRSPRDFIRGKVIQRRILPTDKELVSIEHVRTDTFPKVRKYIEEIVEQNLSLDEESINS